MNPLDSEIQKKVTQWIEYGDEDLRLARHGLTLTSGVPYRLIAYHAQQCAEKYLKAFLVYHRIDFPYTHNIGRLLELCSEKGEWARDLPEADELTPFAITARYPSQDEPVTHEESLRAIEIASKVRETIRKALEKGGVGLPLDL
jgi:HEPN domain-containing protein